MKRVLLVTLVLGAALAVALPGAFARTEATQAAPGITSKSIKIGGTFPLSGPVSSYAPISAGMETYFRFVNARKGPDGKRGVYGRKIDFKVYDDAYNPAQTVQLTRKLVLEDKVFAVVGSLGTEPNLAIRQELNQRKVPQILVSTGASYWGTQYKSFPWTFGWQTDYVAEGRMYARWILANAARRKIAIFYQNDDYGKDYLRGIKQCLGTRTNLIVSELGYEVTVTNYA
jgi:branched-chain amino acid transport system substrate-binding protein